MGLGPPVCERCWVVAVWPATAPDPWHCPICGSTELKANLWSCGVSEEELDANYRFLKFMKGPDAVDNSADPV